ncbi:MAG: hypothetical protein P1U40_06820 [Coxiellaceae bacterium]|nr:hypothetical protein [Coxiellaceae bacterium]
MSRKLRPTKSLYYFSSSASRPAIAIFYNRLADDGVIPKDFPHHQPVHSGVFIYNHRTERVEDVIEGSGDRHGHLILYRNRASAISKLENCGTLPGKDKDVAVYGCWRKAYKIKCHLASNETDGVADIFSDFVSRFEARSAVRPISYMPGKVDCQTCTHYLLRLITGKAFDSPHGEYTLGWGDGSTNPHDLFDEMVRDRLPQVSPK